MIHTQAAAGCCERQPASAESFFSSLRALLPSVCHPSLQSVSHRSHEMFVMAFCINTFDDTTKPFAWEIHGVRMNCCQTNTSRRLVEFCADDRQTELSGVSQRHQTACDRSKGLAPSSCYGGLTTHYTATWLLRPRRPVQPPALGSPSGRPMGPWAPWRNWGGLVQPAPARQPQGPAARDRAVQGGRQGHS